MNPYINEYIYTIVCQLLVDYDKKQAIDKINKLLNDTFSYGYELGYRKAKENNLKGYKK